MLFEGKNKEKEKPLKKGASFF